MLLLDNWNEWGEGHYIAPYREYGFGYLDAVRRVFSTAPPEHEDLIPEDIGMGPYDTAIRGHFQREEEHRRLMTRRVVRPGAPDGLVGVVDLRRGTRQPRRTGRFRPPAAAVTCRRRSGPRDLTAAPWSAAAAVSWCRTTRSFPHSRH